MNWNENTRPARASDPGELEIELQEALARRQRASELFGLPDWESDEDDISASDYADDDE